MQPGSFPLGGLLHYPDNVLFGREPRANPALVTGHRVHMEILRFTRTCMKVWLSTTNLYRIITLTLTLVYIMNSTLSQTSSLILDI